MLAERLEEWAQTYKAEGKAEGEALALQKLLKKRFSAVPADVLAKISVASLEQIEGWLDQVLIRSASSLSIRHVARPRVPDWVRGTARIAPRRLFVVGRLGGGWTI